MNKQGVLISVFFSGLLAPLAVSAAMFPFLVREADIFMATPENYEPSGLVWNSVTNNLFTVSDDGKITRMNMDGSQQIERRPRAIGVGTDFEALTIVNPASNKIYIGIEHPDAIVEYDWQTEVYAQKKWDLTSVLTGANNQGLEGIAFVPNAFLPEGMNDSTSGGLFYAGIQRAPVPGGAINDDYLLYAFDLDLSTSGRIVRWWGIPVAPGTPNSDISDLSFNPDTGLLYVLYDGANRLIEMNPNGTVVQDYSNVPVNDQEGIAIITNAQSNSAEIYIASDTGKMIGRYIGYPVDVVAPVAPLVLQNEAVTVQQGESVDVAVLLNDRGEGALTLLRVDQPQHGSAVVNGQRVQYVSPVNYEGNVSITYYVRDSAGQEGQAQISVTVTPRPIVAVSSEGLVTYLKLDSSGLDSSGKNHTGVLKGNTRFDQNGQVNGAAVFDGSGDYIAFTDSADVNLGVHAQRSVSIWFKADNVQPRQVIFEEGANVRGLAIYLDAGKLYVAGWNTPAGESNWAGTFVFTENIRANTWHHVVLTLDGGALLQNGAFKAYMDGAQFASGAGSQLWAHSGNIGIGAVNDGIKFHSGESASTGANALRGSLDELRIYNRVLSADEVYALSQFQEVLPVDKEVASDPVSRDTLAMHLIFNEHTLDVSGNGNKATQKNGAAIVDGGAFGRAMQFDGVNDYLTFADSNLINIGTHADRSVALWFKAEDVQSRQVIYEEGGTVRGVNIYIENGHLYVAGWNDPVGESAWQGTYLDLGPVALDVWNHVVMTLDGTNVLTDGAFSGYLNGNLVAQGAGSQLWSHSGDIGIGATNNDTKFASGKRTGTGFDFYHGMIDDVRVYNGVLSLVDVRALFTM